MVRSFLTQYKAVVLIVRRRRAGTQFPSYLFASLSTLKGLFENWTITQVNFVEAWPVLCLHFHVGNLNPPRTNHVPTTTRSNDNTNHETTATPNPLPTEQRRQRRRRRRRRKPHDKRRPRQRQQPRRQRHKNGGFHNTAPLWAGSCLRCNKNPFHVPLLHIFVGKTHYHYKRVLGCL